MRFNRLGIFTTTCCLVVSVAVATPGYAVGELSKKPRPGSAASVVSITPSSVRVDKQDADVPTVVFRGVDAETTVSVDWDEFGPPEKGTGTCSVQKARKNPDACQVTFIYEYSQEGTYYITARVGKKRVEHTLEVKPEPTPWKPAPGQVFNDGWRPLWSEATFLPCQVVKWNFDRAGETGNRTTMIDDVRAGLAVLQPLTGLTFTEVSNRGEADLLFRWGNLHSERWGPDTAGIGGPTERGKGEVAFSNTVDWTDNKWAGWDWRVLRWDAPELGPGWYYEHEGPGRVALVIHEVMHAMGFDHVDDFLSIMYPQGGIPNNQGKLSPGDIAGLKTMYLDNPCPA